MTITIKHNNNVVHYNLSKNLDVQTVKASLADGTLPLDKITSVFEKSFYECKNKKSINAKTVTSQAALLKTAKPVMREDYAFHVSTMSDNLKQALKCEETSLNDDIKNLRTDLKSFVKEKKKSYGVFGSIILTIGKIFNIGAVARAKQLSKTMLDESNVTLIK